MKKVLVVALMFLGAFGVTQAQGQVKAIHVGESFVNKDSVAWFAVRRGSLDVFVSKSRALDSIKTLNLDLAEKLAVTESELEEAVRNKWFKWSINGVVGGSYYLNGIYGMDLGAVLRMQFFDRLIFSVSPSSFMNFEVSDNPITFKVSGVIEVKIFGN